MSIDLWIAPTRKETITPAELARACLAGPSQQGLTVRRFQAGVPEVPPVEMPLAVDGFYVVEFSDGINVSLLISDNVAAGCDEEGEIAEFGDPSDHAELIAKWRAVGHSYVITLSGGAYGEPRIRRMEQLTGAIATLVQGYVLVLDPWYSRPRGLYAPGTFP